MSVKTDFYIAENGAVHAVVVAEGARKLVLDVDRFHISGEALFESASFGFEEHSPYKASEEFYSFEELLDSVIPGWELGCAASVSDGVLEVRGYDGHGVISSMVEYAFDFSGGASLGAHQILFMAA